ncbi:MAG: DUF1232 domain-containing protein [Hyphomicrobiales bacterium]|nr:MAG: DUF1232 domain-containing protein [Hyphomicrobiales bacterium]
MDRAKIGEILKPAGVREDARREADVRDRFWRTARRAARQVPFMEDVVAAYYAALDRATPLKVRGTLLAALAYFVMPADMIPDFIVGLGFTDDVAVLSAAIAAIRGHIKPAHRDMARAALEDVDA